MRYFLRLSYNGTNYNGWQIQGNAPSVQKTLEDALSLILKEDIHTTGCGRTDTGVHAAEFFAHFDSNNKLLSTINYQLTTIYRLNGLLPLDIAIHDILPVRDDAHARFDALSRTYNYIVSRHKDPFHNDLAYFLYGKLNIDLMNKAAQILMQHSDFTSFAKLHSQTKTNICKISQAEWTESNSIFRFSKSLRFGKSFDHNTISPSSQLSTPNSQLVFTITADRFLRNMVRAIVGTLLDIGREKINLEEFQDIIDSKNRSGAGTSVPAHALFLTKITYPDDIFITPQKDS